MELLPPWAARPAAVAVRAHLSFSAYTLLNVDDPERELRQAMKELEAAKERRDVAMLRATEAGMSRRQIAAAAGLSVGRVQQIIVGRREAKP
jgi:DNA-directed RNA polymerase specialized sigma24 family protein